MRNIQKLRETARISRVCHAVFIHSRSTDQNTHLHELLFSHLAEIMEVCEIARAMYAYDSKTGMKFDAGQLLNVFEKGEDGWWWGEVQNSQIEGWFPATYVSTLEQVTVW